MDNQDQLDDDDDFVRAMEEGIAEADRGEFISNEEVLR
jgi:predicted transcriptional regulator